MKRRDLLKGGLFAGFAGLVGCSSKEPKNELKNESDNIMKLNESHKCCPGTTSPTQLLHIKNDSPCCSGTF